MIIAICHRTRPAATLLADWSGLCSWQPRGGVQGSKPTSFTRVTVVQLDPAQEEKQARIENMCGERSIKGGKKICCRTGSNMGHGFVLDICHFPRDGSFSCAPPLNLLATAFLLRQFHCGYKYKS